MIYRFKLISDEVSNFVREIEISPESDFLQLRNIILESVGYAKDGMDSFFLCDEDWNRHEQIVIEDFGSSSDEDIWIMEDTKIGELVEEKGQHLAFIFDNLEERAFYMALVKIDYDRDLRDPLCIRKEGMPPKRALPIDEIESTPAKSTAAANPDDLELAQLYGDSEFNDDEMLEGFDSIDGLDI